MTIRSVESYEVLEPLGRQHLYKARHRDGGVVALKILPPWRRTPETVTRFEREIRVESSIDHENVAHLIDAGTWRLSSEEFLELQRAADVGHMFQREYAELLYFVREFVEGTTIAALLSERRPPLPLSISIAIQVARGLGALHERGVIHRNLNPRNVVLRRDGVVKLVDFGLVKEITSEAEQEGVFKTSSGLMIGTAGYMAPEHMIGAELDARSDLFSLGVLLYELVSSKLPYPADDLMAHFRALEEDDPTPLAEQVDDLPDHLDEIVARLLERDPDRRYDSAEVVEDELKSCLAHPDI